MELTPERLQEIKKELVERFDYDIPAKYDHVIQELLAALEASQAENERLEDLYNSDRIKYLDDITLLQTEVTMLRKALADAEELLVDEGYYVVDGENIVVKGNKHDTR